MLTLTLEANTDGGSEAFTFQNLKIVSGEVGEPEPPVGPQLKTISEIQGEGSASTLVGEEVIVEAVVVGDFQSNSGDDSGQLSGFYLQEEDTDVDGNSLTSEGLFVFDKSGDVDVMVGDKVRVRGIVKEQYGLTEIVAESVDILATSQPLPTPASVFFPLDDASALEAVEGMAVVLPQTLVISEYYNYDRYGELVLAKPLNDEARPYTGTAVEAPGSEEYQARLDANTLSRITLDDGLTQQNPEANRHPNGQPFALDNRFRGGDRVTNTTGIMDYRFGRYRIQPTAAAQYEAANPRPATVPSVGGDLTIASFNVLNYFITLDENADICGPNMNLECRGADNIEEFERQRVKILAALAALNADVVGLIEIENSEESVASLVADLNAYLGAPVYAALEAGTIGSDAIKVGFIYKPASVAVQGDYALLDGSVDPRFIDDKNRPALAQTFSSVVNGSSWTAVVNHLKSKGSNCDSLGDPNLNDGQGNCNLTRTQAAQALADWMATDPTGSGDRDVLILGDLNAYDKEDPITVLRDAGYVDLLQRDQGEFAYSYVFDGQFGYLDYALANATLAPQISGSATWAINADEPDLLDYDTSYKSAGQQAMFEANAFRSSDHDPIIVGLELNGPPSCDAARASREILWFPHRFFVPVSVQGVTDPENDPVSITIDAIFQDEPLKTRRSRMKPDAYILDDNRALVRAKRLSRGRGGNGRVYHINYTATSEGGSCSGTVKVGVPVNWRWNSQPIEDGPLYPSY